MPAWVNTPLGRQVAMCQHCVRASVSVLRTFSGGVEQGRKRGKGAEKPPAASPVLKSSEEKLQEFKQACDDAYYNAAEPLVSDSVYDSIKQRLAEEAKAPTTVGASPVSSLVKVKHTQPMLSLAAVHSMGDVQAWQRRLSNKLSALRPNSDISWVVEPKVDGLAVRLLYKHGKLVLAATRGDGALGEDVTHNIWGVKGVPHQLSGLTEADGIPDEVEVRGEVFITHQDFKTLNASSDNKFANTRNAASGSLRLLDPSQAASRNLSFVAYQLLAPNSSSATPSMQGTQWDRLLWLQQHGFAVSSDNHLCASFEEAVEKAEQWMDQKGALGYDADGVVFKLNDLSLWEVLGDAGGDPRWAIALKFPAAEGVTRLLDIQLQIGKTGAVTPLALLEPITLEGARIQKASLHNVAQVQQLDLMLGDMVVVKRSGAVIPQVVSVVKEVRNGSERPWSPPAACPSCSQPLTTTNGVLYCGNTACDSQRLKVLEHFASTCLRNFGGAMVLQLVDSQLLSSIGDFYRLNKAALLNLDGVKEKKAGNLLSSIDASKELPMATVLAGLGIRGVGPSAAKQLQAKYGTLQSLLDAAHSYRGQATATKLDAVTASVFLYFQQPEAKHLVQTLSAAGVKCAGVTDSETASTSEPGPWMPSKGKVTRAKSSSDPVAVAGVQTLRRADPTVQARLDQTERRGDDTPPGMVSSKESETLLAQLAAQTAQASRPAASKPLTQAGKKKKMQHSLAGEEVYILGTDVRMERELREVIKAGGAQVKTMWSKRVTLVVYDEDADKKKMERARAAAHVKEIIDAKQFLKKYKAGSPTSVSSTAAQPSYASTHAAPVSSTAPPALDNTTSQTQAGSVVATAASASPAAAASTIQRSAGQPQTTVGPVSHRLASFSNAYTIAGLLLESSPKLASSVPSDSWLHQLDYALANVQQLEAQVSAMKQALLQMKADGERALGPRSPHVIITEIEETSSAAAAVNDPTSSPVATSDVVQTRSHAEHDVDSAFCESAPSNVVSTANKQQPNGPHASSEASASRTSITAAKANLDDNILHLRSKNSDTEQAPSPDVPAVNSAAGPPVSVANSSNGSESSSMPLCKSTSPSTPSSSPSTSLSQQRTFFSSPSPKLDQPRLNETSFMKSSSDSNKLSAGSPAAPSASTHPPQPQSQSDTSSTSERHQAVVLPTSTTGPMQPAAATSSADRSNRVNWRSLVDDSTSASSGATKTPESSSLPSTTKPTPPVVPPVLPSAGAPDLLSSSSVVVAKPAEPTAHVAKTSTSSVQQQLLKNKKIAFTGLLNLPRDNVEQLVNDAGGTVVKSSHIQLFLLVAGAAPTTKDLEFAKKRKAQVITEGAFLKHYFPDMYKVWREIRQHAKPAALAGLSVTGSSASPSTGTTKGWAQVRAADPRKPSTSRPGLL